MKIAYFSTSTIPSRAANSIQVMKMCEAFARQGHDVTLFAWRGCHMQEKDVYLYYGVENKFKLIRMPECRFPAYNWFYALVVTILAKWLRVNVVYGRHLPACFLAACFRLNTILELHTPYLGRIFSPKRIFFHRLLESSFFKRLVVISGALKNKICEAYNITSEKIVVAHDAADVQACEGRRSGSDKNGRFKAGYVGHMYPGKGVELILKLAQLCPDVDFHLIGGMEKDIQYWRAQAADVNNMIFEGFISPTLAGERMGQLDVLLAPYQRHVSPSGGKTNIAAWMSPLKIFEYMAAGRPIIASDLPVLREVLVHEKNALLCPPDDVAAWRCALERLRDTPELCQGLAKNAHGDLVEKYTWSQRARNVLDGIN